MNREESQLKILAIIGFSLIIMGVAFYFIGDKKLLPEPAQERAKMAEFYAKLKANPSEDPQRIHEQKIAETLKEELSVPSRILHEESELASEDAAAADEVARAPASIEEEGTVLPLGADVDAEVPAKPITVPSVIED